MHCITFLSKHYTAKKTLKQLILKYSSNITEWGSHISYSSVDMCVLKFKKITIPPKCKAQHIAKIISITK
jgi:hypothetical protein